MSGIIKGTTPTFRFTIKDGTIDLSLASHVYATVAQGGIKITKIIPSEDITVDEQNRPVISVYLNQEESLKLKSGVIAEAQVNWVYPDASRAATDPFVFEVKKNLIPYVLPTAED